MKAGGGLKHDNRGLICCITCIALYLSLNTTNRTTYDKYCLYEVLVSHVLVLVILLYTKADNAAASV